MPEPLFDIVPLLPALMRGETVITATDRLARHARVACAAARRAQGESGGTMAPIFSLNQWLDDQWQRLQDTGHTAGALCRADNNQRLALWTQVIAAADTPLLLPAHSLAQTADSARKTLEQWCLKAAEVASQGESMAPFAQWLDTFYTALGERHLITAEQCAQTLIQAYTEGRLQAGDTLHLVGFEQLPPLHQQLLASAGQVQHSPPATAADSDVRRVELPDRAAEWRAAALWSRRVLASHPDARLGIIVPNLGQCREPLERVFSEVFEPQWHLPHTNRYTLPFNISAGTPLGDTPLVRDTLNLLALLRERMELEPLCALLHSPFFGDRDNDWQQRVRWAERLRRQRLSEPRGADWRRLCPADDDRQTLAGRLQQLGNQARDWGRKRHTPGTWAGLFLQALEILGWPGSRRPDSQEYQQLEHFYRLLETFTGLEEVLGSLPLSTALNQLRQLAGRTPFQAQTPDSPIQILGTLEGAGLRFSHCWVLGLDRRQWPPQASPNPLLPLTLQRRLQMPRASVERELQFAEDLTRQYRQCAATVIFSYAAADGEEALGPSPLIETLPLTTPAELLGDNAATDLETLRHTQRQHSTLELVTCRQGPVLTAGQTPGGAGLLKEQAACPFNAFARFRLGAAREDAPAPGLSAAERGQLLHKALEHIWRRLGNSEQLLALTPDTEASLIQGALSEALDPVRQRRPRELGHRYVELEIRRCARLLQDWLALERQRPPFAVQAMEEQQTADFAGLTLSLRLDRIDRLENGDLLLIDYKTGKPKVTQWLGARPEEPQLPLYALVYPAPVSGIAYAQLNIHGLKWLGLGELGEAFGDIKSPAENRSCEADNWDGLRQHWQQVLEQLAAEVLRGEARVLFRDNESARYSADLEPLNRFAERDSLYTHALSQGLLSGEQSP